MAIPTVKFDSNDISLDKYFMEHQRVEVSESIVVEMAITATTRLAMLPLLTESGEGHFVTIDGRRVFIGDSRSGDLAHGQSTKHAFYKAGRWSAERESLHEDLARKETEGRPVITDRKPIAYMLGGGMGVGKSSVGKKVLGDLPGVVRVEPDEQRFEIPEYRTLRETDPDHAVMRVYDESKDMTNRLIAKAIANKQDFIYDATNSGETVPAMVNTLIKNGYDVRANFVDIPIATAMQRAKNRAETSTSESERGRFVEDNAMIGSHVGSAKRFFQIKDNPEISSLRVYDNSNPEPKLMYRRDKGGEEHIEDEARFQQFKRKSNGEKE